MSFNVNDIKANLVGEGMRTNLFQVTITNPGNSAGDAITPFMVNATSIPASRLGSIEVPYMGRKLKLAGDRIFDSWTVTVINDENYLIRNAMEEWSNKINRHQRNVRSLNNYKSQAQVRQMSKDGRILRVYEFHGIFPVDIQAIDLDWGSENRIGEFRVEFQYDEWTVVGGVTGNAGGQ
jgi:T4-like virus tail tube protein gp19